MMNNCANLYNHYTLNKILGKKVVRGKVLGAKYGFNANSGSIGSFVYAMPGLFFVLLAVVSISIALASNLLLSAGQNPASECDKV
jgi:hypothetical protein